MSKSKKATVQSARAKTRSMKKLVAMIEGEVQRRLPATATFEQRNNMSAEVMKEALFTRSDDDLRKMVTDEEEVEGDEGKYGRLDPPSSATYFGRWGPHEIDERLYRKLGVRNGPTIKPIELRAGIIEHMTPDMAHLVGELSAGQSSRELERTLWCTGHVPPGRAFLEKRVTTMAGEIAGQVQELEEAARASETIPAGVASVSFGLDRMSIRMSEPATPDGQRLRVRTEPYLRKAPAPKEFHYRKAWVGSMTSYDGAGNALHTLRYGTEADADPSKLADRVAADVASVLRASPLARLHCIQDGAPELRAMPEALARALPTTKPVELIDFHHLLEYLDDVVDTCEPASDPSEWKGWYRGELLRDDGAIDRILAKLRRIAKTLLGKRTKARKAVGDALSYIRTRKHKMRYASHYAAKLPIGSGATESTCFQMQARVKRPGQSWQPLGLRGVLTTRGLVLSERWDTAWPAYAATHRRDMRCAA